MTKVPFNIDLTGKVAVITGAGGGCVVVFQISLHLVELKLPC